MRRPLSAVPRDGTIEQSLSSPHTSFSDGNDGGNGMLEARVAKLEADVGYIRRDVDELRSDVKSVSQNMILVLERLDGIKESLEKKPSSDAVDKKISDAKVSQIIWTIGSVLTVVSIASGIIIKVLHS